MYCEFDFINEAGKSDALIFLLDGLLFHDYKIGIELCYIIKKYNFSIYSTEAIIKCTLIFWIKSLKIIILISNTSNT